MPVALFRNITRWDYQDYRLLIARVKFQIMCSRRPKGKVLISTYFNIYVEFVLKLTKNITA